MDNNPNKMDDASKSRYQDQETINKAVNEFHLPVAKLAKNFGVLDQLRDAGFDIPEEPELEFESELESKDDDGLGL